MFPVDQRHCARTILDRGPWSLFWLLLLAVALVYTGEFAMAVRTPLKILNLYMLPFYAGIALLPMRQEAVLGALLVVTALISTQLGPEIAPAGAIGRLPVQIASMLVCIWSCNLNTRLKQSSTLLEAMFSSSPVGIVLIKERSSAIVLANPAIASMLGEPQGQLKGRRWSDLGAVMPAEGQVMRVQLHSPQGDRHVDVVSTAIPGLYRDGPLHLLQAMDCQQRIEAEQALAKQTEQLQLALRASLKANAVLHELRQPLALLLMQVRLLQRHQQRQPNGDGELAEGLRSLLTSTEEINSDLEAMASLLRSVKPGPAQRLDLAALSCHCLELLEPELGARSVALRSNGLSHPLWINADQVQLRIAITNLLRNAVEALQNQPPASRRIAMQLQTEGSEAVLCIADSGPGLPQDNLEALQLRTSKSAGLGLGLFTTDMIATNHGGKLVPGRSSDLGGAAMVLRLPLAETAVTPRLPALPQS